MSSAITSGQQAKRNFSRSGYLFGIDMLVIKLENRWPGLRLILG